MNGVDSLKKIYITGAVILLLNCLTGCNPNQDIELDSDNQIIETLENNNIKLETEIESETEELQDTQLKNAPFPETDFNAYIFNDKKFNFVSVVNDDDTCAEGNLSVENIDGNFMLKFTDLSTNAENLENSVQKICISVDKLLNPDQLESVYAIGFDICAQAKDDLFLDENGKYLQVPANISGSGKTLCANGEWYNFEEFSASNVNEYRLERSDLYHVEFKFESGKYWDSSQENVNLIITRSRMQNISDLYLDNIIFYDQEGNSIPLNLSY